MTEKTNTPWILTKAGVLTMLFLVLGPFGLPFLYKSPDFTKGQKTFWTTAVLLYTIIGIAIVAAIAIYLWRMLLPLLNIQ